MRHRRSVLLVLLLLAGSLSPPGSHAQDARAGPPIETTRGFSLEQNYPNPVNPETWIPFSLEDELFRAQDSVLVTIRIYNFLKQVVAIPRAIGHPRGRAVPVFNLRYGEPGRQLAYWDGTDQAGRRLATGVYYVQMEVAGQEEPRVRKIIVDNPQRRRRIIPWLRKP